LAERIFGDVKSGDGDVIARRLGAHQTPLGKLSILYAIAIVIAAVFVAKTGAQSSLPYKNGDFNFRDVKSGDGDVIARRLGAHQTRREKLSIPYAIPIVIAAVFVAKTGAQS
jgi:uncharacterized MAPEG superfamily protein